MLILSMKPEVKDASSTTKLKPTYYEAQLVNTSHSLLCSGTHPCETSPQRGPPGSVFAYLLVVCEDGSP